MVGKAQRTKNNVKASNSGRSAQLLANLPNTSFIGFSTLKDAALHTTPDLFDDTISPDFQIILKKMNKKDSVTKHKALHEFADLCNSSDIETLKSVLPLWPRLYSILSIDIENRVREATQYAHKCMVTQVKRNIAPHLKHLIGPWIVSQFDTYPPAASVAKTSFEDVFPPLKRTEVFAFCKDDLFNYIIDNLIVQTPQTMSNPKITDAVNMEMKYERVISSTLQAYALFISKLPPDTLTASLQDHTSNVLSTAKFWKYQKHESNLIRSSWYLLVSTLIEKCPEVFETDLKKLAVAIFSNLNEKDIKVNANVWDAALYCVLRYESDLWKCISVEKLVVPNVCSTLENGFHGNGSQIAPKLLPLLSKLPSNDDQPLSQLNIYEKILSSLLLNIKATSVKNNSTGQMSHSEFDAVLKCFTECCRYVLKTESNRPISADLCRKVVIDYVFPLFRIAASHVQFSLTVRFFYQLELESTLTDTFWEQLTSGLVEGEEKEGLEKELSLHASLVQSLWNPFAVRKCGGGMKVKFQEEQGGDEEDLGAKISEVKNNLDSPCEGFTTHLHNFISSLLQHYLFRLSSLPRAATSKALERSLILHICKLCSSLDSKFVYDLLPLPSAFNHWGLIAGDSIYELMCKYIAKLNIDQRESNKILEQVACNQMMSLFTWCLKNITKFGAIVSPWLKDERLQDTLLSIVSQVTVGSESHTELLEKCFIPRTAQNPMGDQKSNERYLVVELKQDFNAVSKSSELNEMNSKNCQSRQLLSIIVNSSIADRIFLRFLNVFRQFGDTSSQDKIDYENCARVVSQFLRVEDVVARHKKLIGELLVCLVQAIMRSGETREMLLCWEAALVCTQPNTSTRRDIWRIIHSLCVETLLTQSAPKAETTNENEDVLLGGQIIEKSVLILSKLMVEPEINWDTIFRPSFEIEWARAHWGVYVSMHESVRTCEQSYELAALREWNLPECQLIQTVFWNLHVYAQLTLNLLQKHYGLSQSEIVKEEDYLNKESEKLMINLSENLTDFLLEYFLFTTFAQQYLPTNKTDATAELFSRVWSCCGPAFKQKVQSLDMEKNGYLRSIEFLRGHLMEEEPQGEVGNVVASSDDVMKLVLNTSPLQSPITRDSFIKYVRDHSKDQFGGQDGVVSLVQVFTKLLSIINKKETESEYVASIVDTIRGEIMLMVTSHLVHYYTHVTSRSDEENQTPLETRWLILAAHLLRCYQEIDEYCRERSGTEFSVEWNSVFADDCKDVIANMWVWTASMDSLVKTAADLHLLNMLCATLCTSHASFSTLDTLCPLLLAPSRAVQVTAYEVIRRHDVIERYDVIASTLTSAQTVVDALLQNFSLGDTCIVLAGTDSYTYSLGYLLTWLLIVHRCDVAESRHADVTDVALWLKSNGYMDALLRSLLELMPEAIVHGGACVSNVQQLFLGPRPPTISEVWSSARLSELACGVYYRVLRRFPALVRGWWNESCSPSESTLVEKLTSRYVSPLLCAEELRTAAKFTQENMQIRVFPGTKEVVATYTLEEASMEITITLPSNHPLGVIRVDSLKNLFPNTQWIKQITKFLIHANGTICDGLSSWKSNMDKKFDGVEECYICFCILHARNHELPRKSCRTCQKKFHSYCLFKWFTTSNKSTCPICRNLF